MIILPFLNLLCDPQRPRPPPMCSACGGFSYDSTMCTNTDFSIDRSGRSTVWLTLMRSQSEESPCLKIIFIQLAIGEATIKHQRGTRNLNFVLVVQLPRTFPNSCYKIRSSFTQLEKITFKCAKDFLINLWNLSQHFARTYLQDIRNTYGFQLPLQQTVFHLATAVNCSQANIFETDLLNLHIRMIFKET